MTDPIASLLGEWSVGINAYSVLLRIIISGMLAAIVGCERSSKRHSAGLRTIHTYITCYDDCHAA